MHAHFDTGPGPNLLKVDVWRHWKVQET